MNAITVRIVAALCAAVGLLSAMARVNEIRSAEVATRATLRDGFMSPPKGNYPSMWVFKLGVDSPREVITYDLEEFAKVGISEFMIIGNGAAITAAKPSSAAERIGNLVKYTTSQESGRVANGIGDRPLALTQTRS